MTREEEIHKAAKEFAFSDKTETSDFYDVMNDFYFGAKWADEHPNLYNDEKYHTVKVSCLDELNRKAALYDTFLEKACEWLKKELIDNRDNFGYNVVSSFDTFTLNEFIEEFKKAMEE